jgi:hypothetical protein
LVDANARLADAVDFFERGSAHVVGKLEHELFAGMPVPNFETGEVFGLSQDLGDVFE